MTLVTGQRKLLSVLKYDHEEAVTYDITHDAKAILKAIANSFTKSADALQKSALIEIVDGDDHEDDSIDCRGQNRSSRDHRLLPWISCMQAPLR